MKHVVRFSHLLPFSLHFAKHAVHLLLVGGCKQTLFLSLFALVFGLFGDLCHVDPARAKLGESVAPVGVYDLQAFEVVDFRPEVVINNAVKLLCLILWLNFELGIARVLGVVSMAADTSGSLTVIETALLLRS